MKVRPKNTSCSRPPFNTGIAFTELSDTPDSYLGHAGESVVVNAEENGLEFSSSSSSITFADWDASTNLAPAGVLGTWYIAQNNSTTMLMPDGGIVTAGVVATAKIINPGTDITDTTKWLLWYSIR